MDFWVFAYGSLMWRPNFLFSEAVPAVLEGAHRALCVYSAVHRGTPMMPGLVLGLNKGGRCLGMAYRIPHALVSDTRAYLKRRENVTNTYIAAVKPVKLIDGTCRDIAALCYMVNRYHRQYAGDLPLHKQAYLVRRSHGASGANIDYVINTVTHLRELGVHDPKIERVMTALGHSLSRR